MEPRPSKPDPLDHIFFGELAGDEETEELLNQVNYRQRFNDTGNNDGEEQMPITERPATYDGRVSILEEIDTVDIEVTGDRL